MGRLGDGEMGRLGEENVVRLSATWYEMFICHFYIGFFSIIR
ncbi:hypothetical protein [Moorena producens]